jgi:O-antigen/teichoic acid export membrane protein
MTQALSLPSRRAACAVTRRARAQLAEPLFRGAYSLMANTMVTSTLGVLFWLVAARLYPASVVGRDSALVATMVTLSSVCQLNLANAIVRFLPQAGRWAGRSVATAYGISAAAALGGATLFVAVAPVFSPGFAFLREDPLTTTLFIAAVVLWGVFALQDSVLTALRRATWVPLENAAFGALKLAALPLMVALGHGVFIAWVIPMGLLLAPVNCLIFRRALRRWPDRHVAPGVVLGRAGRRRLLRFLLQDYSASVFTQATLTLLPVLVIGLMGSSANAHFYIPFTIVTAFDVLFQNVTTSLTVEGAIAERRANALARLAVRRSVVLLVPGVVVLVVAAPLLLWPFGGAYVQQGASVLRIAACASVFRATIALYAAACRVQRRGAAILAVEASLFALVVALTLLLSRSRSLDGVAAAWLCANGIVAAGVLKPLIGFLRSASPPGPCAAPPSPAPGRTPEFGT